ncbi:MAG TPA: sugar ABC transporter permease [Acidimicrobiales bacterium]|nr:sugar ABC transporter permease [Acidimicrobiales bacterium]
MTISDPHARPQGTAVALRAPVPKLASAATRPDLRRLPRMWRSRRRYHPVLVMLLLPSILLIGVFSYYPAVRSLIGGFYAWNGFSPPTYAGVSQFKQYVLSPTFGTEMRHVLILVAGNIAITLVSQFTAAEIVTRLPRRTGRVVKYLLVLPIVFPPLVLIEVWDYMLEPGTGLIDRAAGDIGLPQPAWLSDPHTALIGILLIGFPWISNLGFLIFLGGLQNLPRDILDAATVDGTTLWSRTFHIDVPLLLPQFRIVVILSGIYAVQNFIPILLLTNGGPGTATLVPGLDMYQSAFQNDQYGYGMAIGTLLFAAMLIFTLVTMRVLRPRTT